MLLQFQLKATPFSVNSGEAVTCLNFVETGPSVLREMPWITVKEHKVHTIDCLLLLALCVCCIIIIIIIIIIILIIIITVCRMVLL